VKKNEAFEIALLKSGGAKKESPLRGSLSLAIKIQQHADNISGDGRPADLRFCKTTDPEEKKVN